MRILIVGASGFIGYRLYKYFNDNSQFEIFGTYNKNKKDNNLIHLNLIIKDEIERILQEIKPDCIIWIAGNKNVQSCEEHIDETLKINTKPIEVAIEYLNIKRDYYPHFIYLSTDYVFDGVKGSYTVLDKPNPKTKYGISKYLAEIEIKEKYKNYTIIRSSAVVGRGGTFYDWIISKLMEEKAIELFEDSFFTPTPIDFLVKKILYVAAENKLGTYHICGTKKFSRYTFGIYLKSLSTKFIAEIKPIKLGDNNKFIQKDLSMIPSEFAKMKDEEFEYYLRKEISND